MTSEVHLWREALIKRAEQCDKLAEVSRAPACYEYRAKAQAFREAVDVIGGYS